MTDFIRQETPPVDCSSRNSYIGTELSQVSVVLVCSPLHTSAEKSKLPFVFTAGRSAVITEAGSENINTNEA